MAMKRTKPVPTTPSASEREFLIAAASLTTNPMSGQRLASRVSLDAVDAVVRQICEDHDLDLPPAASETSDTPTSSEQ